MDGSVQGGNVEIAGIESFDVLLACEETKIGLEDVEPESAVGLEVIFYGLEQTVLIG